MSDVQNRGDYYPIYLTLEAAFKKEFHETGFWKDGEGKLSKGTPAMETYQKRRKWFSAAFEFG
jgi:hypothetical protein